MTNLNNVSCSPFNFQSSLWIIFTNESVNFHWFSHITYTQPCMKREPEWKGGGADNDNWYDKCDMSNVNVSAFFCSSNRNSRNVMLKEKSCFIQTNFKSFLRINVMCVYDYCLIFSLFFFRSLLSLTLSFSPILSGARYFKMKFSRN